MSAFMAAIIKPIDDTFGINLVCVADERSFESCLLAVNSSNVVYMGGPEG
jgi:hypothetical protein